jgi:hypothetical protein
VERVRPFYDAIVDLSESGGTIGPLPDGTIIEVKPVTWDDVAHVVMERHTLSPGYGYSLSEVLALYNNA